jgi:thiosulfate reductase cytochrome b subunit
MHGHMIVKLYVKSCCTGGYRALITVHWLFSVVVILLVLVHITYVSAVRDRDGENWTLGGEDERP